MLSEQQWMMNFDCLILLLHKTPAEEPQLLAIGRKPIRVAPMRDTQCRSLNALHSGGVGESPFEIVCPNAMFSQGLTKGLLHSSHVRSIQNDYDTGVYFGHDVSG